MGGDQQMYEMMMNFMQNMQNGGMDMGMGGGQFNNGGFNNGGGGGGKGKGGKGKGKGKRSSPY